MWMFYQPPIGPRNHRLPIGSLNNGRVMSLSKDFNNTKFEDEAMEIVIIQTNILVHFINIVQRKLL